MGDNVGAIEIILRFVAGEIDTATFENALYSDLALEELLRDPSMNWSGTYIVSQVTDLYEFLIMQNYSRLGDKVNAIGALELFLQKKDIEYSKDNANLKLHSLMLNTQPKYIDVDSAFFEKYILPSDRNMTKVELKKTIRENYSKHFKYQTKPPTWLQNPAWIMKNGKPLFFVGQLKLINDIFHDDGAIYVFLDTDTGEIETVKQFF